ncbi:NEDD8 ultimate buster 1 [Anopheles ziemanni]|uniref:NEDD8 ultimate buster 1 n=1 Tax=Anopheles coustani TaxID=139045 RepID=UPI00265A6A24|nr:NEDD8 ultimate buster 1 [Anopheles coustani]XP_058171895.1 NEDD8 ultimate buster 1 [Anopheles ziemanni]
MNADMEDENFLIQLRAKLNERKIKLWETPYLTAERKADVEQLAKLAETLGPQMDLPCDRCVKLLQSLQHHALDKLQAMDEYQKTGVATFKVRAPTQTGANRAFDLKVPVSETGSFLCEKIGHRLSVDWRKIKLVCSGTIVDSRRTLKDQKLPNGAIVMALVMAQCEEEAKREFSTFDRVHKIRADAEMLINENDSAKFLSLEDQAGNAIFLPTNEKKALLMALTLYEKGKAALKEGNFEEALLLFLEADHDFRTCNSQLLGVVDNYALLNLDIVWCYLCLKNLNQLPDAEQRLQLCEQKFRQSYGENMKRVTAIKGDQSSEKTLLVRLHLLKAILFFHQNKRDDARTMFRVVDTELLTLRIDDGCLTRLMECGFSLKESRIALRACSNNVEAAIEYIQNHRQTLEANERRSDRERALYERIGHEVFGSDEQQRLKLEHVDQLIEMGYQEELAAVALKRSNNDINEALNELQNNLPDLQRALLQSIVADDQLQQQLVALGFPEEVAKVALKTTANNYDRAMEFLLTNISTDKEYSELLRQSLEVVDRSVPKRQKTTSTEVASTSDSAEASSSKKSPVDSGSCKREEKRRKKEMLDILFKSFSKDMDTSSDAHLDLALTEETELLEQYKKLLGME